METNLVFMKLVSYLPDKYVSYELNMRQINCDRSSIWGLRVKLADVLRLEKIAGINPSAYKSHIDPATDYDECSTELGILADSFFNPEHNMSPEEIHAKQLFLKSRIKRIQSADPRIKAGKEKLYADLTNLFDRVSSVIVQTDVQIPFICPYEQYKFNFNCNHPKC